jgi:hypothetical protein
VVVLAIARQRHLQGKRRHLLPRGCMRLAVVEVTNANGAEKNTPVIFPVPIDILTGLIGKSEA